MVVEMVETPEIRENLETITEIVVQISHVLLKEDVIEEMDNTNKIPLNRLNGAD